MTIMRSILFFGLPGLAIYVALYFGVPLASAQGVPLIISWSIGLWLPIIGLLVWVLCTRLPDALGGRFAQRFRLRPLGRRDWAVILGAFVVLQICGILLSRSAPYFAQLAGFGPPPILPELFDPQLDIEAGLSTFFGVPVEGNWWLVLFWLGWLVVNIGGEELLWRGYALPLQERALGRAAWLVNGLCWNLLIHAFMRWNFITMMPISLAVPYLVQRYQNTWIGICRHGFGNLLVLALLIPSIAGWL